MPEALVATEIDALTGETIVRVFTPDELAQREADAAAEATRLSQEMEAEAQRAVVRESAIARFKKLGFTDAEIATLVLP